MQKALYIDVLLPLPVPGTFTYLIKKDQAAVVKPGMRVNVPFGHTKIYAGLVLKLHDRKPADHEVKEIISVLDPEPVILGSQIRLWEWVSEYYMCTPGEVFKAALPQRLKLSSKPRSGRSGDSPVTAMSRLNPSQLKAFKEIKTAFDGTDVVLLHGVTSSGKTEIYIHLIREAVDQGRQVLYLLPEIAITTQIITRLKAVFGKGIAVYHSRSTDAARVKTWNSLLSSGDDQENNIQIILGVRSSVFLYRSAS
jgi:primosomal protein N' (replication factor Y)